MTDTTRDLIQQLTDGLDTWLMAYPDVQPARHYRYGVDLLAKARAYLDQPEPEELTDEELLQIAAATIDPYEDGIAIGAYEAETECAIEAYGSELIAFARAVLARWGRPAVQPIPVSERPWEREGWCDNNGWCWCFDADGTDEYWSFDRPEPWVCWTHVLPHYALPIPEPTTQESK